MSSFTSNNTNLLMNSNTIGMDFSMPPALAVSSPAKVPTSFARMLNITLLGSPGSRLTKLSDKDAYFVTLSNLSGTVMLELPVLLMTMLFSSESPSASLDFMLLGLMLKSISSFCPGIAPPPPPPSSPPPPPPPPPPPSALGQALLLQALLQQNPPSHWLPSAQ